MCADSSIWRLNAHDLFESDVTAATIVSWYDDITWATHTLLRQQCGFFLRATNKSPKWASRCWTIHEYPFFCHFSEQRTSEHISILAHSLFALARKSTSHITHTLEQSCSIFLFSILFSLHFESIRKQTAYVCLRRCRRPSRQLDIHHMAQCLMFVIFTS